MRLRFGEPSEAESSARRRITQQGQRAWSRLAVGDVPSAVRGFAEISPHVELGVDAERSAWLSALEPSVWPLAELLLCQAPVDLSYALSLGRAARPLDDALEEVKAQHGVDLSRASLRAGFSRGHLLEITLGVAGGTGSEIEQIAAENLVRKRLGERLFETWIGAVHVAPKPRGGPLRVLDVHAQRDELELGDLFDTVAAAAHGVLRGLPEVPCSANGSATTESSQHLDESWTMLEVEPLRGARGVDKDDLFLASTCMPELLRCYLDGAPCSSRRFSRTGEQFLFLSYADGEHASERRVARRSEIEAALSACLAELGAVTGVGLGVHTTYIDFALRNLETGLSRVVARLRDLDMPPQSFIQFFDSELSEEWLSISPDSRLTSG
ncbi:MAG TPA: hypothetical protein VJN18_16185 [Polyangiaceae bacterium]|nr:hypothetical protein [Polyangiaceae bacterium]